MEGWLWKKGQGLAVAGNYKRRWFKLQILVTTKKQKKPGKVPAQRLALTYFKKPEHVAEGQKKLLGIVDLSAATALSHTDPSEHTSDKVAHCVDYGFHAVTPERTWYLIPETADELRRWVHKLASVLPAGIVKPDLVEHAVTVDGGKVAAKAVGKKEEEDDGKEGGTGAGAPDKHAGGSSGDGADSDGSSAGDTDGGADADAPTSPIAAGESASGPESSSRRSTSAAHAAKSRSAGKKASKSRGKPAGAEELKNLRRELDAAYLRIAQLERTNRELTERVEMRDIDRNQVLGLEDPLLSSFGLGKQNNKRAGRRSGKKIRRGTGTEDDWEDTSGCRCVVM